MSSFASFTADSGEFCPDGVPLSWLGNEQLINRRRIALFCSTICSGGAILTAVRRFQNEPDPETVYIGGFQTDVGKMLLNLLLRNGCSVILFPARSIHRIRLARNLKDALDAGNLALASSFNPAIKRADRRHALKRNNFVASIADEIIIVDCHPESSLSKQVKEWLSAGKNVEFLTGKEGFV